MVLLAAGGCTHYDISEPLGSPDSIAAVAGISEATVHFATVTGADAYVVEAARTAGFSSFETHEIERSPATIPMPYDGQPWFVRVAARDGSSTSRRSVVVEVSPLQNGWLEAAPVPALTYVQPGANAGSVLATGDFNGDLRDDLVFGMPEVASEAGRMHLHYGRAGGLVTAEDDVVAGTVPGTRLGDALAVGDFDCDGFDDLAAGEPFAGANEGAVRLYRGSPVGLVIAETLVAPGGLATTGFGDALAAGRTTSGGCDDLVVGQSGEIAGEGYVHLFLGGPAGLAALPAVSLPQPDGFTGWGRVVAAADVDGDGSDDVVVGEPAFGVSSQGRLRAFTSPVTAQSVAAFEVEGGDDQQFASAIASVGDLDGDGFEDLAVMDRPDDGAAATVRVFRGGSLLPGPAFSGSVAIGAQMNALGADFDGDGTNDLLVADPLGETVSGDGRGEIGLYRGGPAGLSTAGVWTVFGSESGAELGFALASGDFDGDGWRDLAAGAPGELSFQQGNVRVFRGLRSRGILADAGEAFVLEGDGYVVPVGATFRDPARSTHACTWTMFDGDETEIDIDDCTPANVGSFGIYSSDPAGEVVLRLRVLEGAVFGEAAVRGRKEAP